MKKLMATGANGMVRMAKEVCRLVLKKCEDYERTNMQSVYDPRPSYELNMLESEYFTDINLTEADREFYEQLFEVALDSGAGEHVADDEDAPNYPVEPSAGSKAGQHFIAANNQRIPNRGQMTLSLRGEGGNGKRGRDIRTTFQVAKVSRPLWSVGRICDEGFDVKFTKDEALVLTPAGKVVCRFKRSGGLYVAKMSLKHPVFKQDFQRQGAKA